MYQGTVLLIFLILFTFVRQGRLGNEVNKLIDVVSPTTPVMKFVEGGSVTLTWRYFYDESTEQLDGFICGYKNKDDTMIGIAADLTGYSFLASHELSPQMISKGILSDADSGIAKRVINLYAANDGNTRKRGFTIVRLRDSDARKLICGLRLQDKELHYGGEIQLVATIPVGVQQMTSNKKATKSNGQMIIIFVSVGVVSLVAISTLIGLFVWWKRRKVYNYALGGQRDSFISCNSSDDEETEYQKK